MIKKIRIILSAKFKWGALILILLMGIGAILELCGLALIIPVISAVADSSLLEKNQYLSMLYRISGAADAKNFLVISASSLILFYLVKNAYCYFMVCCQSKYTMKLAASLADRMYKNYLYAPYSFHLETGASELLARLNQVYDFTMGLLLPLMLVLSEGMVFAAVILFIFIVTPVVGICALVLGGLAFLVLYLPLKKIIAKYGRINYEASLDLLRHLTQGLNAVKEMKLSLSETHFAEKAKLAQIQRNAAQKKVSDIGQIPRFAMECFSVAAAMIILMTLLFMNVEFSQILITASFFVAAMSRLMPSFSRIQYNLLHIRATMFIFEKIFHDLTEIPQEKHYAAAAISFCDAIEVQNITFRYRQDLKPVLENFSVSIKKNECAAFVGKTGGGKSTLADIIMGFSIPEKGTVKIDQTNIRENIVSWREKIGYVPQNIHIFDDTIAANIAFGITEDKISYDRISEVVKLAQLDSFIESLPDGIQTKVGESGSRLSGGQRQRVAIARALYRNPELLVLDEATSALDQETEQNFISALQNLKGKFTIIMIAHRLSSIKYCDRTVVIGE